MRTGMPVYRRVRAVKQADQDDNTGPVRTVRLDPETRQRLAAEYDHARSVLAGR